MKIKLILTFWILLLIFSTGCGSFNNTPEQWEGISGNSMIIIISEFFPFEENISTDDIKKQIIERLNQRASLVVASYISINLSRNKISHQNDITLNNLINDTISSGKLLKYDCSENNYCTSDGGYNITELQKNLETINKQ